jgi:hypothetical protein
MVPAQRQYLNSRRMILKDPGSEEAPFTPMNSYQAAFMNLDPDGSQYISSNNLDQ